MAKYHSILKITGAIGDLVFYNLNGVPVVRKKSGFNRDDFKQKESYERVRENSSEFGHCSQYGKMLRQALLPYPKHCGDQYHYQKFAKVMTEIKDLDHVSERGERKVYNGLESEAGKKLLRSFTFGKTENMQHIAILNVSIFDNSIELKNAGLYADELELITLQPNTKGQNASTKVQVTSVSTGQKNYIFGKSFEGFEGMLLYFAVLKKDGVVLNMGFL